MSVATVLNVVLIIIGAWFGIACVVGAIRFVYRPLILISILGFSICLVGIMDLLQLPYSNWITRLGLIGMLLFNLKYREKLNQRGITDRQLFLFTKQ
jgi:hypothetical protein